MNISIYIQMPAYLYVCNCINKYFNVNIHINITCQYYMPTKDMPMRKINISCLCCVNVSIHNNTTLEYVYYNMIDYVDT